MACVPKSVQNIVINKLMPYATTRSLGLKTYISGYVVTFTAISSACVEFFLPFVSTGMIQFWTTYKSVSALSILKVKLWNIDSSEDVIVLLLYQSIEVKREDEV